MRRKSKHVTSKNNQWNTKEKGVREEMVKTTKHTEDNEQNDNSIFLSVITLNINKCIEVHNQKI